MQLPPSNNMNPDLDIEDEIKDLIKEEVVKHTPEDGVNGKDGKDGKDGERGAEGKKGKDGNNGKDGKAGKDGINGEKGEQGAAGKDGKDGSPDTGYDIIEKINEEQDAQIDAARIKNLPKYENRPIFATSGVKQVIAGSGIAVDDTNLAFPKISASLSPNENYVTDAEKAALHNHTNLTALNNVSGINTGDQVIKDTFGITVDGGATVLTTGTKGYRYIEQNSIISGWQVSGNASGSIVFDVKRSGVSIAGTEKPTLTSQQYNSDTSLTTWTISLNAGDIIEFVIDSSATITRATLTILITKI